MDVDDGGIEIPYPHGIELSLRKGRSHEHAAVLFRPFEGFVVQQKAMLDRGHSGLGRVEAPLIRDRMGRDLEPGPGRFVDNVLQVVDRIDVPLVVDDDLDPVGSEVDVFPDGLSDFVARVGIDIVLPADILLLRVDNDLTRERRNDLPRDEHLGAGDKAVIDRLFQVNIGVVSGVPHVPDRREAGFEHRAGVDGAKQGPIAGRLADHIHQDIRPQFLQRVPADFD